MLAIDLQQQVALITGASQGLGAATARRLHAAGARVVINYFEEGHGANRSKAEQLVAELGAGAIALAGDVRSIGSMEELTGRVLEEFGQLNIVINNAAILRDRTLKKISAEEWDAVIQTNLTGVFNTCKAVVEHLAEGGRIVNLASIAAAIGFFGQCNYAAAKAGVTGLTRVLSRELARRQITVNAVAPGVSLTEMGQSIPDEARAQMLAQIPLGRFAEPHEIADVILFLCSPLASYMTGQVLHVNGGWFG